MIICFYPQKYVENYFPIFTKVFFEKSTCRKCCFFAIIFLLNYAKYFVNILLTQSCFDSEKTVENDLKKVPSMVCINV